jgi:tRNA(Ile)-lysidine synthase
MAARKLRHDFLARTAARLKVSVIALAHHADDQVELFFLRLLRGSGGEGLSGMKWTSPSPSNPKFDLVRPLLAQPKSALLEHAATNKIRFREDATNASLDIKRNLIRHELLPLLRRKYQPALDKTILRVMDIIGADSDFVTEAAIQLSRTSRVCREHSPSDLPVRHQPSPPGRGRILARSSARLRFGEVQQLDAPFDQLPVAIQRRCLHLQLIGIAVTPSYDLIEELRLHPDQPVSVPAPVHNHLNRRISRDAAGVVHVRQTTYPEFPTKSVSARLNGKSGDFEFDGVQIGWRRVPGKFLGLPKSQPGRELFDADKIGDQIMLRHWQAGDRFQPIGMNSTVKLQDLFTNAKVTRAQRHSLIVALAADGGIFWVEGVRISERYKLTKSTIRRLHWRWRRR